MIILKEGTVTWEQLIESLREHPIDLVEIISESESYFSSHFNGKGKLNIDKSYKWFYVQTPSLSSRLQIFKKSVQKIEHDTLAWNVLLINGDNWRIHTH